MKTHLIALLSILFLFSGILKGQTENQPDKTLITFTAAGNYNDFVVEQWKKAANKFHAVAAMLNEPIRSKKTLLNELKSASKVIDEIVDKLDNVQIFNDDDKDFMLSTFKLLDHYQRCIEKKYPQIIEKLTKPSPDYAALQEELDELSALELTLTETFLEAQAAFAEHYNFELK